MNEAATPAATATYEQDVVAWATEQARLLRERRFEQLDVENIAEEIEDVGKSEKRELAGRMAALLAHLIKWQWQPERRGKRWRNTIAVQRRDIHLALAEMPSLRAALNDPIWQARAWNRALVQVFSETTLTDLPDECPWSFDDVMADGWLPEQDK